MKLRKLLVLVGIVLMTTSLLVACVDKKAKPREEIRMTQEERDSLKKEQDKIALYIVNHYEDVKKIEFVNYYEGGFGQSDSISVMVNDDSYFKPIFFEGEDSDNYSFAYSPDKFNLIEKKVVTNIQTLDDIKIIYYKGENK